MHTIFAKLVLSLCTFAMLVLVPAVAAENARTETTELSPEILTAEYQWLLPNTVEAQELLAEGILVEYEFLDAVYVLRELADNNSLDTTQGTFEQQMAGLIAEHIQQLRQRIKNPPRNMYGHGANKFLRVTRLV